MAPRPRRARDAALFAALVTAWGLNYLFVRVGLAYAAPLWLAASRAGLGAVLVAAALAVGGRGRPGLDGRGRRDAALLGIPTTAVFFGLWFTAAARVLPGEAAVLVYTFPLWVALFAYPALGHRPTAAGVGAVALGFAGVVLITEPWGGGAAAPPVAVAELLAGAVSWAVGTVLFQRRFAGGPVQEANLFQLAGGASALLLVAAVAGGAPPAPGLPLLGVVLWLGGVGTAFGYSVWFALLGRIRAATLSAYVFLVPVVALSASVLLLGERLDLLQAAGVAAVLASLVGTARASAPLDAPRR